MNFQEALEYLENQFLQYVNVRVGFQVSLDEIQKIEQALSYTRLPGYEVVNKLKGGDLIICDGPGGLHCDDLAIYIYFLEHEGAKLGKDYVVFDEMDGAHVGISYDDTSPKVVRALEKIGDYEDAHIVFSRARWKLTGNRLVTSEEGEKLSFTAEDCEEALKQAKEELDEESKQTQTQLEPQIKVVVADLKKAGLLKKVAGDIIEQERLKERRKWLEDRGIDT